MEHRSSQWLIHACVLAAGTSTRFGDTKLVRNLRGKPLLQHALLAAQGACEGLVTLVVGHDQEAVTAAAAELTDNVVVNTEHQSGVGTSISAGVRACRGGADAILIVLADQPLVTAEHLNDLISTWSGSETEIVASAFDEILSPPILFPQHAFDALSELSGDMGAKKILSNKGFNVRTIEFPPASMDIDTIEDHRRLDQD